MHGFWLLILTLPSKLTPFTTLSITISLKNKAVSATHLLALFKRSLVELKRNDPLRMAGATSFFTTFAVTPILLIIIQLLSFFLRPGKLSSSLIEKLRIMMGDDSANQIEATILNIRGITHDGYATVFEFIFLCFVATTLFMVIENSLDQIWRIRIKADAGIVFSLRRRFRSFCIILLAGILFLLGLITEGAQAFIGNYIDFVFPHSGKVLNNLLNECVFMLIASVWFTVVFRFLTDGRPEWRIAFSGGVLTAILFTIGKLIVHWGLSQSNIGTIYGASGSIVLIMLFVFYSAFMFYYGGCFIKILSEDLGQPIRLVKGAYRYEIMEL